LVNGLLPRTGPASVLPHTQQPRMFMPERKEADEGTKAEIPAAQKSKGPPPDVFNLAAVRTAKNQTKFRRPGGTKKDIIPQSCFFYPGQLDSI